MFKQKKILFMICTAIQLGSLAQNFIKPEFLLNEEIDKSVFSNSNNFLPEYEIFFGTECEDFFKSFPKTILSNFKNTCLTFYIKATEEMADSLPIKNQFFKEFKFLDPNICLDSTKRHSVTDLQITIETFKRFIDIHKVIEEWREIPYFYNKEQILNLKNLEIPEFWQEVCTLYS